MVKAVCLRVALGLVVAAVPLLGMASPASAAQNTTTASGSLSFVESNFSGWTCTASLTATHNTDDARHPFTEISTSAPDAQSQGIFECAIDVYVAEVTITYTDTGGDQQTTTIDNPGVIGGGGPFIDDKIGGTVSNVHVTARFHYQDCDPSKSATCDLTLNTAPK
jgi:hypothetical protein